MILDDDVRTLLEPIAPTYPDHLPAGADSRGITYRLVSSVELANHDGPAGMATVRYQFTAHADTHGEALELARELLAALKAHRGPVGSADVRHLTVANVLDLGFDAEAAAWQYTADVILTVKE